MPNDEKNQFPFLSEFYRVEKIVEGVFTGAKHDEATEFRIEALLNVRSGKYLTRAYTRVSLPITAPGETIPDTHFIWASYNGFPWTDGDSADDVIHDAMNFIRQWCEGQG